MYAEFSQISLLSMSNSEPFKDEEKRIEFDILKRPPLEFQEEYCEATATATYSSHDDDDQERQVLEDHEEKNGEESHVTAASKESEKNKTKKKISFGEFKATDDDVDDDDDGFKTPTSLDHKIPVIKQCPPAPRKPKPPQSSNKRKASPSRSSSASTRRNLQLDLSQEVESLFATPLLDDLHRKVKKARTQENQ